ncbi:MAG: hypothetical protein ABGX07_06190 [Pirellulaceae bacterium]
MRCSIVCIVASALLAGGCDPLPTTETATSDPTTQSGDENSDALTSNDSYNGDSYNGDDSSYERTDRDAGAVSDSSNSGANEYPDPVVRPSSGRSDTRATAVQREVKLTTCVALPQSLPTGTCMLFSVEYHFIGAGPDPRAIYYWVIEPNLGAPVAQKCDMRAQGGSLKAVAQSITPGQGPFNCHIVEETKTSGRRRISRSYSLPRLGQGL